MSSVPGQDPMAPTEYLRGLWRRKWLFLVILLVIPAAVLVYSLLLEKRYESTATVSIQRPAADLGVLIERDQTVPAEGDLNAEVRGAARAARSPEVAALAVRGRQERPGALLSRVEVRPKEALGLVTIAASSASPGGAAALANDFARALVASRRRVARDQVTAAIRRVQTGPTAVVGRTRASELVRLRSLRAGQTGNAEVISRALPAASPASPKPLRNTAAALTASFVLALAAVLLAEWLDRRIRRTPEVEELTGLPLLATVPRTAFDAKHADPAVTTGFEMLRDTLPRFNRGEEIDRLLVTSPTAGDGKTTVALNLARALARAGRDVVLVEADLRGPRLAAQLGFARGPGLSQLLAGDAEVADALEYRDGVRILPAGEPRDDPSEAVGSDRMKGLLGELAAAADVVVIDSPPLLAVSDAVVLLDCVSGVIMVARVDHTPRADLVWALQLVRRAQGKVYGAVVTGLAGPFGRPRYGRGYGTAPGAAPRPVERGVSESEASASQPTAQQQP